MQKYALRKVITPSEREQIDSKQWKKDNTKQSYLPSKSYSRAGESSKTILNNNVRNRNNSFSKQNKSMLQSPSYNTSKHDEPQAKENDETEESKSKKDLTLERYRKLLAKYENLSVESLEEKPFNSTEGNTEIKEKVKLVSTVNDKFTEINKNETSHSIEQINDKTKTLSTISQNSESALSTTDSISSSRQLSMISTASKASLTPSFSTLDELQAKLQSTLEDEKEVQELTKEREKSRDIIYRMRERTTDLVTKNNELFNSKLKLKYELEFIKEQMEVKTQELEKVIKERNIAEKQVNELRNELNQVKKENENNENDEKKHYWGFRPFGF
ncbi:hypothetical protein H8356DRAFT_962583 [Neocallimastix lanati (nom. inval.)]|nr:hypothetical protein H8356DRAFT_962583 [Neocallimastix sp. JGI-2020a]